MAGLVQQPFQALAGIRWRVGACLLVASLCGCADIPADTEAPPPFRQSGANHLPLAIGVLTASWHSGIVLPTRELGPLQSLLNGSQAKYLSFGWGNRRFYMAA